MAPKASIAQLLADCPTRSRVGLAWCSKGTPPERLDRHQLRPSQCVGHGSCRDDRGSVGNPFRRAANL